MKKGTLYLIPSTLGDTNPHDTIPQATFDAMLKLKYFAVEEVRTARRFLSVCGLKGKIDDLVFFEINEHTKPELVEGYIKILLDGNDMGLISEAGLPAVADPGAYLVELAQNNDITVMPMSGPSSLMMALMGSGMNGQCFAFTGYLPVKQNERRAKIKEIEKISMQISQSQIIIETPYRNDHLFADMLAICFPDTRICIAADITLPTQLIKTKSVAQWRKENIVIGKRPCVFVLYAGVDFK